MPRPRFTLRVVLVVTAIVAVLAWQVGTVARRRLAMDAGDTFVLAREAPREAAPPTVNAFRTLLGDVPVRFVYVAREGDWERRVDNLRSLFPEAEVITGFPEPILP